MSSRVYNGAHKLLRILFLKVNCFLVSAMLAQESEPENYLFKRHLRAREMAQWVKLLAIELDNLSLIPGSRNMQELTPTSCSLTSQRVAWHTHACAPIHRDTINQSMLPNTHTWFLQPRDKDKLFQGDVVLGRHQLRKQSQTVLLCGARVSQEALRARVNCKNYLAPFEITSEPLLEQRLGIALVTILLPSFISKKLSVRHL